MSQKKIITFASVFAVAMALGYFLLKGGSSISLGDAKEVDWRQLGDMDYITGNVPAELKSLDGKPVKVPGFMVALEDNMRQVKEFLLVPSPQACIHVPPPPPNQMVLVNMSDSSTAQVEFGPVWVYGILKITPKKHMYGESSFQLVGHRIEPYR